MLILRTLANIGRSPLGSTRHTSCATFNSIRHTKQTQPPSQHSLSKQPRLYRPEEIYLQVLGNGCPGGPSAVVVVTADKKYLFNCGQGTHRLFREYKIKMKDCSLFFTSLSWKNIGGLPGYALMASWSGVEELLVHGYEGVLDLLEITRHFVKLRLTQVRADTRSEISDDLMRIRHVIINKRTKNTEQKQNNEAVTKTSDTVIAYIGTPVWRTGKISLEKCAELEVPPGPYLMELKAGNKITLPDGRVIKPSDVLESVPTTFVVLECPSEEYIDSFLLCDEFQSNELETEASESDMKNLIVHMTPKNVFNSVKYKTFLQRFPPSAVHLQLCEENSHDLSEDAHRTQYQLNLIHNEIFPLLPLSSANKGIAALTRYYIKPHTGLDYEAELKILPEDYLKKAMAASDFEDTLAELKQRLNSAPDDSDTREYPRVIFLGTGSALASKERNVSSILIATNQKSYILLDCGEGTWTQMVQHYGPDRARDVLRSVKCVFISHIHFDHHFGLITIIKERANLGVKTKLPVLGPPELLSWLESFGRSFEPIDFEFFYCDRFDNRTKQLKFFEEDLEVKRLCIDAGVNGIEMRPVPHCSNSYAIRINCPDYSVVYSGDTMPSYNLCTLGYNCDLLIHEATMEDGLEHEARMKHHSTTEQAVKAGQDMNAKFTILTHFSQRYCRLPNVNGEIFQKGNVGCAFDHMEVAPKHLKILAYLYPSLKSLFKNYHYLMNYGSSTANKIKRLKSQNEQRTIFDDAS